MKPDDPNKPKEEVAEAPAEWPLLGLEMWTLPCPVEVKKKIHTAAGS